MREVVFGQDGSFSFDALVQRYNADLANGYGNLTSRILAMINQYFEGVVPHGDVRPKSHARPPRQRPTSLPGTSKPWIFPSRSNPYGALVAVVDGYITEKAPWKLGAAEDGAVRRASILYTCAEALRIITALAYPVLPDATARIWAQLGLGNISHADLKNVHWGQLASGTKLGPTGPIFPRAEKDTVKRMHDLENNNTGKSAEAEAAPVSEAAVMTTTPAAPTPAPQPTPADQSAAVATSQGNRGHHRQGTGSIDHRSVPGNHSPSRSRQPSPPSPSTILPKLSCASGRCR